MKHWSVSMRGLTHPYHCHAATYEAAVVKFEAWLLTIGVERRGAVFIELEYVEEI